MRLRALLGADPGILARSIEHTRRPWMPAEPHFGTARFAIGLSPPEAQASLSAGPLGEATHKHPTC